MKQSLIIVLCCILGIFAEQCAVQGCSSDEDCWNEGATCCNGACVDPFPLGATCGTDVCGSCRDYCVNGRCTEYDVGCPCRTDEECGSDPSRSFCLAGTCSTPWTLDIGQACQDTQQCKQGSFCIGSVCQGNLTINETCTNNDKCQLAYWCYFRACTPRLADGQYCESSRSCGERSWCNFDGSRDSQCLPLAPIGGDCTTSMGCASQACRISTQKCVAAGSLISGEICLDDSSCRSGSCQLGPQNGTYSTTRYCWEPNRTLADGSPCNPAADDCIGVCWCDPRYCANPSVATQCISAKSLHDGSFCQNSMQCKNLCGEGLCFTMEGLTDSSTCRVDESCNPGSICQKKTGCTPLRVGSACRENAFRCAPNQECICNVTSLILPSDNSTHGTCQVTNASTIFYNLHQKIYKSCSDVQSNLSRYSNYCSAKNVLDAPAMCQNLLAQSMCCQGCPLLDAMSTFKDLHFALPFADASDAPPYLIDCTDFTVTIADNQCCGTSNSTCGFKKQIDLLKNCPIVQSSSDSTSNSLVSTSNSQRSTSTSSSASPPSERGSSSGITSGNSTMVMESDARAIQVGAMIVIVTLALFM